MTTQTAGADFRSRIRIAHTQTVKDGWRHETSIELEWSGLLDDRDAVERLQDLASLADQIARQETARRRALDGQE